MFTYLTTRLRERSENYTDAVDKRRVPHEGPRRTLPIDAIAQVAAVIADVESSELNVADDLAIATEETQLRRASLTLHARLLAATEPVQVNCLPGGRRISGYVQEVNDEVVLLQCYRSLVLVRLACVQSVRGLPERGVGSDVTLSTAAIFRRIASRPVDVSFVSGERALRGVVRAVGADHCDINRDGEVLALPFRVIARVECVAFG